MVHVDHEHEQCTRFCKWLVIGPDKDSVPISRLSQEPYSTLVPFFGFRSLFFLLGRQGRFPSEHRKKKRKISYDSCLSSFPLPPL